MTEGPRGAPRVRPRAVAVDRVPSAPLPHRPSTPPFSAVLAHFVLHPIHRICTPWLISLIFAPFFPLCRADAAIAASYHEKREADSDFLKNLVERTSQYRYSTFFFFFLLHFRSTTPAPVPNVACGTTTGTSSTSHRAPTPPSTRPWPSPARRNTSTPTTFMMFACARAPSVVWSLIAAASLWSGLQEPTNSEEDQRQHGRAGPLRGARALQDGLVARQGPLPAHPLLSRQGAGTPSPHLHHINYSPRSIRSRAALSSSPPSSLQLTPIVVGLTFPVARRWWRAGLGL